MRNVLAESLDILLDHSYRDAVGRAAQMARPLAEEGDTIIGGPMELVVKAHTGHVEIHTQRRSDGRWASEFRYVPKGGAPLEWRSACSPEGFVTEGMALSAAILLGKQTAEEVNPPLPAAT